MGIISRISEYKQKFREVQQHKGQVRNEQVAQELNNLRKERIRLEGKAHLEELKEKELKRIKEAKEKTSKSNKVKKFAKGLKKVLDKNKPKGIDFGGEGKGFSL